jgi:hypothetical protein
VPWVERADQHLARGAWRLIVLFVVHVAPGWSPPSGNACRA